MRYAAITQRLVGLGGDKWAFFQKARARVKCGENIIELTIGEPDVPVPDELIAETIRSIRAGRTNYAHGQGEAGLLGALADYYSNRSGRSVTSDNILCLPGTQTALYLALTVVAEAQDEVLVGDPMYATYEAVIRATGADIVSVPLRSEASFCIQPIDIRDRVSSKTSALLLTSPHNPTGAILTREDIIDICELAAEHDFWIISDEVYADMIFEGEVFHSPFDIAKYQDRVIVVSSISKSHAAPGFRSGWCVGPADFVKKALPLSEAMLFGNQPFIADMSEKAVRDGSSVIRGMCVRFSQRARRLEKALATHSCCLEMNRPQAGMFALINTRKTGLSGEAFAEKLLNEKAVAVMPGSSFGESLEDWIRVALTVSDEKFDEATRRIIELSQEIVGKAVA